MTIKNIFNKIIYKTKTIIILKKLEILLDTNIFFTDRVLYKKGVLVFLNLSGLGVENNTLELICGLTSLEYLTLNNNGITSVEGLQKLTNLKDLYLSNNSISYIEYLAGLTNLESLHLDGNRISDIYELRGLTNLRELFLNNNKLEMVAWLNSLTELTCLHLHNNKINWEGNSLFIGGCKTYI